MSATDAEEFDCLSCGACCRQARPDTILVPEQDLLRWRREGKPHLAEMTGPGHFSEVAFLTREIGEGRFCCVHLGTPQNPHACSIYADRGTTCHELQPGSWQCREARRDGYL